MLKNIFRVLICISLLSAALLSESKTLNLDDKTTDIVDIEDNVVFYKVNFSKKVSADEYLMVKTETTQSGNFAEIYMSETVTDPSRTDYTLIAANKGGNLLYIPLKIIQKDKKFNLGIYCAAGEDIGCNYTISFTFVQTMTIEQGKTHSFLNPLSVENYKIKIPRSDIQTGILSIFVTGGGVDDIEIDGQYVSWNGEEVDITFRPFLQNGDIATINLEQYPYKTDAYFNIQVTSAPGIFITVGSRLISEPTHVIAGHQALSGYFQTSLLDAECINLDPTATTGESILYNINVSTITKNAELFLRTEDTGEETVIKRFTSPGFATINETQEINRLVCIRPIAGTTEISYQLQITNLSLYMGTESPSEPKVNGYIYTHQLLANQIEYYRHTKYSQVAISTNYNMKVISGYPVMYVHKCITFPSCFYTDDYLKKLISKGEIIRPHGVGDFYSTTVSRGVEKDEMNAIQNVLIVQCGNSEDCQFEISFMDTTDTLILNENQSFSQFLPEKETDLYTFEITNRNTTEVIVTWYTYSGDSFMQFTKSPKGSEIKKTYNIANKEFVRFKKDPDLEWNELVGKYNFSINAPKNTYYIISFIFLTNETENIYHVDSGALVLETIRKGDVKKKIKLDHIRNRSLTIPFIATFFSMNCKVDVKYKNKSLPQVNMLSQHEIEPSSTDFKESSFTYTISIVSLDQETSNEDDNCMVYISSNEVSEGSDLVIPQAIPVKITLNNNLPTIRYLYPHPNISGDVIVNFLWETEYKLKMILHVENTIYPSEYFARTRQIIVTQEQINQGCTSKNLVCNIVFEIISNGTTEEIINGGQWKVIAKSQQLLPSYLKKMDLRQDSLFTNSIEYYVSEIALNEEGEVVVNFNRGSWRIIARIVEIDVIEKNPTYNGRIVLPTTESGDLLPYDPFTKTVTYSKSDTSKCLKSCEIYIGIISDDKYIFSENSKYMNDFSIFIRSTNNKVGKEAIVNIPVNEYVVSSWFGTTENNDYDFYSLYVPNETDKIIIEFHSEICNLYVNFGDEVPKAGSAKWTFASKGKTQYLKSRKRKQERIRLKTRDLHFQSPRINLKRYTQHLIQWG